MALTYNPAIFAVGTARAARDIILTQESAEATTDRRWEIETPYLVELILAHGALGPQDIVIDYGCGIGRVAAALIERTGCGVIGVDSSASMRALAAEHVRSDNFLVCAPEMLGRMAAAGLRARAAIAVWVLQHCLEPERDLALIHGGLASGGRLVVVNNHGRAVPTLEQGWVDDGKQLRPMIEARFTPEADGALDPARVTQRVSEFAFWAAYRRP